MKRRFLILAVLVAAFVCLPESPANDRGAFSAYAGCGVQERENCWSNNGYWDFGCCTCSLPAQVEACEAAFGYWDYCSRTCS